MAGILSAFNRRNQKKDPMRESAALTTVYLLEQNQKFEQFMRQKVDELESRVAAQQARLSTREEAEERELWAALEGVEALDDVADQVEPADNEGPTSQMEFGTAEELSEWDKPLLEPSDDEEIPQPVALAEPEVLPDYLTLIRGASTESEADMPIPEDEHYEDKSALTPSLGVEMKTMPLSTADNEVITETSPANSSDTNFTEHLAAEMEPDQYESFDFVLPDGDESDEIWPDSEVADEVELLAEQPVIDENEASLDLVDPKLAKKGVKELTEPEVTDLESTVMPEQTLTEAGNTAAVTNEVEIERSAELETAGQKNEDASEVTMGADEVGEIVDDDTKPWEASLSTGQKSDWT